MARALFGADSLAVVLTATFAFAAPAAAIDTSDREAVRQAWKNRMEPNLDVRAGWTGSVEGCRAGRISDRARKGTLRSLNFVRDLAGLDPVRFSDTLSARAQKAALIMEANHSLSHYPDQSWKCWTKAGANAAGASNLAMSYPSITAGGVVAQYMSDFGTYNTAVGHRRWVMNPHAKTMGAGMTTTAQALYVLGPGNPGASNPHWVPWPTAGYFPSPLEPYGRWSLSSGWSTTRFGKATISVRRNGTALDVHKYRPVNGYGQPTVVFRVKGVRTTGVYRVEVRHIGGGGPSAYRYTVRLFAP